MIRIENVSKSFTLHQQGGTVIEVLRAARLKVEPGECVALTGPSGTGKSTLLRLIYGNYRAAPGSMIDVDGTDMASADARAILALRRRTLGYVSQFLRVVPRVPAVDVVADPVLALGTAPAVARKQAQAMLARLNLAPALWALPPVTFSGGEQQRVNIARGFLHPYPVLLLDEPTASLDAANRAVVYDLIAEARARGAAILGIFHDPEARARICDREVDVSAFAPGRAAA